MKKVKSYTIQSLNIYRLLFLFIFLLNYTISFADPVKTVYSIVSGASWTNGAHWSTTSGGAACNCVPDVSKDVIYIETNTNSATGLTLGSSVTVTVKSSSILTITGNTVFTNGSILSVQSGSEFSIIGDLTNNNNSDQITITGDLSVSGNFLGGTGSKILGTGDLNVTGTVTTTGTGQIFGSTNDFGVGPWVLNVVTLPISLLFFECKMEGRINYLSWSTITEKNNDFFTVERSNDGVSFEEISIINGSGNSNEIKEYSFQDHNFLAEINYYRLKQTDFDGMYDFSKLISIDNREGGETKKVSLMLNLFGQEVTVNYRGIVLIIYTDGSSIKIIQ